MKILWITNGLLPEAAHAIGLIGSASGGWMTSMLELLKNEPVSIAVASSYNGNVIKKKEINGILYYYLPFGYSNFKCNNFQEQIWKQVQLEFNPDVVHIHGTEYSNGIGYMRACGVDKVVVSIQGLLTGISKYERSGMPAYEKICSVTMGAIYRLLRDRGKYSLSQRVKVENEYLLKTRFILGRTQWDKSYALTINPDVTYIHCGELLRAGFYNSRKWDYNKCIKHSIFISGGSVWLKGFYFIIKALSVLKASYPDATVYVAGDDYIHPHNFFQSQKMTLEQKCIYNKARSLDLLDNIVFTGTLSEDEMINYYLRSNVFVSASTIENSSNAICEAQILGCPVIASFVGGTPSLVEDGKTGYLYRFDDERELAYRIMNVFEQEVTQEFKKIEERHSPNSVLNQLMTAYNQICNS